MEVTYELDEGDLIALARFQVYRSPHTRRRFRVQRFCFPVGLGLIALGTVPVSFGKILPLLFGSLAVLSFAAYPLCFQWATERRIHQVVRERARPSSFARRTLRAGAERFEQISESSESRLKWNLVEGIEVTPTHAFVSIGGVYSVVVPRMRLEESEFLGFVDTMRRYAGNVGA